jgi:hypothetical protein
MKKRAAEAMMMLEHHFRNYLSKARDPKQWIVDTLSDVQRESSVSVYQSHFELRSSLESMKQANTSRLRLNISAIMLFTIPILFLCRFIIRQRAIICIIDINFKHETIYMPSLFEKYRALYRQIKTKIQDYSSKLLEREISV